MTLPSHEQLHHFIRFLTTAAANAALYNLEHRQVERLCAQALEQLSGLFRLHTDIRLKIIEKQLIFNDRKVADNLSVQRLITALEQYGISHLQIEPGVYHEELLGLINTLSKRPERRVDLNASEHIRYSQLEIRYRSEQNSRMAADLLLTDVGHKEAERFSDLYLSARSQTDLDLAGISEIVNGFVGAFNEYSDAFLALAPLRSMDEYTYTHSTNICLLNLAQARQLGIEGQQLNEIGIAAMLHDVGKMFIPPGILSKTEALSEEEWHLMQQHPRLGAEYLLSNPGVPQLAVVTAYEHHMGYNGQGYPKTRRPWKMHICSHMTAISDTYDAMRTRRSYEESLDFEQIIDIMLKLAGNKLHPQLTYNFLQLLYTLEKESTGSATQNMLN